MIEPKETRPCADPVCSGLSKPLYSFLRPNMADIPPAPVSAFISYSLDSTEHEAKVFKFTNRLIGDDIDAIIDKFEPAPEDGWPAWMQRNIIAADFVLMICTATYRLRAENNEVADKGHGVLFEATIISNLLYAAKMKNKKMIPILFEGSSSDDVPVVVASYTRHNVSTDAGYLGLLRHLKNDPLYVKQPVRMRRLPAKQRNEESLPGPLSLEMLSKTMSNPKYAEDIYRLDRTWQRSSVINRETTIIVVGTNVISELLDRSMAEVLRDEIDRRGGPYPFRRGVIVTHEGWYTEAPHMKDNAVIAIGGPLTNKLTDEFDKWVPAPGEDGGKYPIAGSGDRKGFFRRNSAGRPQVGLWGKTAYDSRETVEHYIEDKQGLDLFLSMIWK